MAVNLLRLSSLFGGGWMSERTDKTSSISRGMERLDRLLL